MRKSSRRVLHWVGSLLAIVGVVFVIVRLFRYSAQVDISRFGTTTWLVVAGFAVVYGVANFLLAVAWRNLLIRFRAQMPWRWVVSVYGVSQLAKYVPGNIFQFAGRQAIGMADGVSGGALAKSTVWELCLLCVAGGVYSFLALPLVFHTLPVWLGCWLFVLAAGAVAGLSGAWLGKPTVWAFMCYLGFLAASGSLFAGLIAVVSATAGLATPWLPLVAAFVVAWLVGLVTPGAPAGVGVRELVLLFLLKDVVVEADLILAVALGRLVTVVGDLLYFSVAVLIKEGIHIESPR